MIQRFKDYVGRWHPKNRSDDYRRSIRNAAFNAGEGVITPVLWVISTPVFISKLGTDHFGIWMLVNGVIGTGGLLSLGLTEATTKFVSKYRARNDLPNVRRVVSATFLLYLVLGLLATVVVIAVAPLLANHVFKLADVDRPSALTALRIGGLGILFRFMNEVVTSVLQGFERFDLNARIVVIINSITMGINITLALAGFPLAVLLITTVVMIFVGAIVKAVTIRRRLDPDISFVPRCNRASLHELIGFGFYAWIQKVIGLLVINMDRILLGAYVGMTAVAYYTVCLQVLNQLHSLLARGAAFLFPFTSSLSERGDAKKLSRLYNNSQSIVTVLTCALVLPVYLFGGSILQLWIGEDFARHATLPLELLCLKFAISPLALVNYYYMLGLGKVKLQAFLAFLANTTWLLFMFALIPGHGILGAVFAAYSVFPFMLFNRLIVEKWLFGQFNLARSLSVYLPVLVCLAGASFFVLWKDSSSYGLVGVLVGVPVSSAIFAGVTWLVMTPFRKLFSKNRITVNA